MRLLNTRTLDLKLFLEEPFPDYAILSHRWGLEEMSYQEFEAGTGTHKNGYQKIYTFCETARNRGLDWCWVDPCAIDKTSSAELSEAINSMYKWYGDSSVCLVYLPDVELDLGLDDLFMLQQFRSSCWFTRGWTLQELLAPRFVEFYSSNWTLIGDKVSMTKELSAITTIGEDTLLGTTPIQASSISTIMSWASRRVTTRKEDIAYSLLGLFQIHMPLLYGEGDRAFTRLQEEILKQSSDQSLFAWDPPSVESSGLEADSVCGILAPSPACFERTHDIRPRPGYWDTESALTNRGVRLRMPLKYDIESKSIVGILACMCSSTGRGIAIEFHATSNSLEDFDHLVRRLKPARCGVWNDDPQIQFTTVYLATEPALLHLRQFGPRFLKNEYEFHVVLQDSDDLIGQVYYRPAGALVKDPSVQVKLSNNFRRIAVLNPANSSTNTVTGLLSTTLSEDIALGFGYPTLRNGLLDVQGPWVNICSVSKNRPALVFESVKWAKQPQNSIITMDGVRVTIQMMPQSWWSRTSRSILVSFENFGQRLNSEAVKPDNLFFPFPSSPIARQPRLKKRSTTDHLQRGISYQWAGTWSQNAASSSARYSYSSAKMESGENSLLQRAGRSTGHTDVTYDLSSILEDKAASSLTTTQSSEQDRDECTSTMTCLQLEQFQGSSLP